MGVKEAVDLDKFLELVIDSYNSIQEEKDAAIRDIFVAVDVNTDIIKRLKYLYRLTEIVC